MREYVLATFDDSVKSQNQLLKLLPKPWCSKPDTIVVMHSLKGYSDYNGIHSIDNERLFSASNAVAEAVTVLDLTSMVSGIKHKTLTKMWQRDKHNAALLRIDHASWLMCRLANSNIKFSATLKEDAIRELAALISPPDLRKHFGAFCASSNILIEPVDLYATHNVLPVELAKELDSIVAAVTQFKDSTYGERIKEMEATLKKPFVDVMNTAHCILTR